MPDLPNEIVCHIVDLVDCVQTLWTLLTVSRRMSLFAIPSLYRDLCFDSRSSPRTGFRPSTHANALEKLARTAKYNKNLLFTTSFSAKNESVGSILPFLRNLRRLSITMPFVAPETLTLVPRGAQLTHLVVQDTVYTQAFAHFLEDHPTLTNIDIDGYRISEPLTLPLSPTALPKLRSLSCPLGVAPKLGRPSVTALKIANASREDHYTTIPEELARELAAAFPSLRSVHFADPIHFRSAALLIGLLPDVVYLQLYEPSPGVAQNWQLLATSRLMYIRLTIPATGARADEAARGAFGAIEHLKYLDIVDSGQGTARRYHRASKASPIVDITDIQWQPCGETIANDIYQGFRG
ncbi:hypothetical protein PLEOSDRAFT_1103948 [Pleurotus ostreatus PC15]|uniref:F-box domain-containing protein n=1 Tax=Pleurotus ostreatus (strain PC15) TaxID=1137138 RepID=A0A067NH97_PLEO1|nr:hypothetical protein PLEOSDRAFT_1103948 [Pleurotus ostreatus PC15]